MNIQKATAAAMESAMCMKRDNILVWRKSKIKPTNSDEGCLLYSEFEKAPSPRWQPRAEDLVAEDWILVP